ncbi:MAG: glycosyltransferase [Lachnospiraceae bacterium]|nr:glycosyltransferase [Lachnospiraceae bacterium]
MGNRIFRTTNFIKTVNYFKKNGIRHTYYAAKERLEEERKSNYYYRKPSAEELEEQRRETADYSELFSIVVPAFETKEEFLRDMLDSVCGQSYGKWELIIADASESDTVEKIVLEAAQRMTEENGENRIKYRRLTENKGISGNTNAGIEMASGDYIALLDHDDFLTPDALYYMAQAVHSAKEQGIIPALLYTDEDKYENNIGYYISPHEKLKFNLDLILSNNYICHFTAVEAKLMKTLQLRGEFDGAQDYDLVLRVVGQLLKTVPMHEMQRRIIHISRILYHWRSHADSTAENTASKSYAYEAGKNALTDFCAGQGWNVEVNHSLHLGFYEIAYVPDILTVRTDIGIVGGRVLDARGRICGGAFDANGVSRYMGLHKEYSGGSTHRAALKQDAAAVDIRCIQVRPELREQFEQITGLRYEERTVRCKMGRRTGEIRIADMSGLICDEAGYRKLSMELGRAASEHGYRVLWNPEMTVYAKR